MWDTRYEGCKSVMKLRQTRSLHVGESLWWWVVREFDTFVDAAFQSGLAGLEKLLFLIA